MKHYHFELKNEIFKKLKLLAFIVILFQINEINAQEVKCSGCKQLIGGKYIVEDGDSYHPNHFVCAKCNKPINGNYYKKDGKIFDTECYTNSVAPDCAVCDKPLMGQYLTDLYGMNYHHFHEKEIHRCDNCNRIISQNTTKGGVNYTDGRYICNICNKHAVKSDAEYDRSLNKIFSRLQNYGLNLNLDNVALYPVDRTELKNVSDGRYSNSARGYCQTKVTSQNWGGKSEVSKSHTIYILDKIPLKYIEATLAHELMHVWISENVDHKLSNQLEEGSCNFIAYTNLKSDYSDDAQNIIKLMKNDPDPIYGHGFRKVYENFRGKYLSELLNYLKRYKSL